MIKILIAGDSHCGDTAGLTPPAYIAPGTPQAYLQTALWQWWEKEMVSRGPYDFAVYTGDMTEGANTKNTIELYTADTEEQGEIAASCFSIVPCAKENMYCVYGTPFHTAGTYSYENHFADSLGIARPKVVQRLNIDDMVRINVRHTVGTSKIPYGQGTPAYKEMVNELLNAVAQDDEAADICIRGHAHYSVGMRVRNREAIIAPCLKYPGGIFGRKMPEAQYDMGFGVLEIYGKGDWRYIPIHYPLQLTNKREWVKLSVKEDQ